MTSDNANPPERQPIGLEADDLDGHTLEELSNYLDAGRTPSNPSIDDSPGCQLALQAMSRLQNLSRSLLESDAGKEPALSDSWVGRILSNIAMDARAGRNIPLPHPASSAELAITEGAVRGIIRATEAEVGDVIIGRCHLDGDVTIPGEPITIRVDASIIWGRPIQATAQRLRDTIYAQLRKHTDLTIAGVDITIRDLYRRPPVIEAERQ